jgi:TrpR family trp operon transcriptional repressor
MNRNRSKRVIISEEDIISVFSSIRDRNEMNRFFHEILTQSEIQNLALRWELMKKLKQGIPQRKIASDLKISLCKITRGSKIVKNRSSIVNQYLAKQNNQGG